LMKFSVKGIKQIKEIFHTAVESGELLGKSVESSYMTDLLQVAINSGRSVTAVPVCNSWIEVDTVKDLKGATTKERLSKI
jgi:hypothetical protein